MSRNRKPRKSGSDGDRFIKRHEDDGTIADDTKSYVRANIISYAEKADDSGGRSRAKADPFTGLSIGGLSILHPPYDPKTLTRVTMESNILPQCIDAMAVNVDGFGYTLELSDPDLNIAEANDELKAELKRERDLVREFVQYASPTTSLVSVRKQTRRDQEKTGNAYWEIVRDAANRPAEVVRLPSFTMRMTKKEPDPVEVEINMVRDGKIVKEKRWRRFRRFIQIDDSGKKIFFKEYGDTRQMDFTTGKIADGVPEDKLATEILHFKIEYADSPYGVPRWIGNLISTQGSRASEELNFLYFINGRHIPLAILVSGGMLTDASVKKIEEHFEKAKGVEQAHKIMILEAEPATVFNDKAGSVRIEIKPMVEMIQSDALFQEYDENNRKKIRSCFRIPKILIGESEDYNRSTVEAAIAVANAQVFDVERREFDDIFNRTIMADLGIVHYRFVSKGWKPFDNLEMADILVKLDRVGAITPQAILSVAQDALGTDIAIPADSSWLGIPHGVLKALIGKGLVPKDLLAQAGILTPDTERPTGAEEPINMPPGGQNDQEATARAISMMSEAFIGAMVKFRKDAIAGEVTED